ncbi:MAG: SpoIIE family protein phosphatase [Bacteroidia bacterium]
MKKLPLAWGIGLGIGLLVLFGGLGVGVLWWMGLVGTSLASWTLSAYGIVLLIGILGLGIGVWWVKKVIYPLLGLHQSMEEILRLGKIYSLPRSSTFREFSQIRAALEQIERSYRYVQEVSASLDTSPLRLPAPKQEAKDVIGTSLEKIIAFVEEQSQRENEYREQARRFLEATRLSHGASTVDEVAHKGLRYLIECGGGGQGALYLYQGESLTRIAEYAYTGLTAHTFCLGEGLVGEVAKSLTPFYTESLSPETYKPLSLHGGSMPKALFLFPLVAGEDLQGVAELVLLRSLSDNDKQLFQQLGQIWAAGLRFIRENTQYKTLLDQMQTLTEALAEKNAELYLKNQLLHQTQKELEKTQQRLMQETDTLQAHLLSAQAFHKQIELLLSYSHEIVALFEKDGRLRYVSPSVQNVLGYTESEVVIFFRYTHPDDAGVIKNFFRDLLTAQAPQEVRIRYRNKSGTYIYLLVWGMNQLATMGALLLRMRDVTSEVEAQQQFRARLKFQSLADHAPDIIIRLDRQGQFLYVNPSIEKYTGYSPSYYIRKNIYSVGFSLTEVQLWQHVIEETLEKEQAQEVELSFPSIMGERVMQMRCLPEYSSEGIHTVLMILHDITELRHTYKRLEDLLRRVESQRQELEEKNLLLEEQSRDILDSLQYTKRLQRAILPVLEEGGIHGLKAYLMYQPRDVVSGDFYWWTKVGTKIFVAVADCTGHGVPGAVLSFMGYTLLHTLIQEEGLSMPSDILTRMDKEMARILRQGDSTSRDGIDMGLVAIDTQKHILHFCGAYRPLLFLQPPECTEIKGNRTSLGEDREDNVFLDVMLSYREGDRILLFSDGITDQFNRENKKFTSRRLIQFLKENAYLPTMQLGAQLERTLSLWRGEVSQIDDLTFLLVEL